MLIFFLVGTQIGGGCHRVRDRQVCSGRHKAARHGTGDGFCFFCVCGRGWCDAEPPRTETALRGWGIGLAAMGVMELA